jgi:hypothetical protein
MNVLKPRCSVILRTLLAAAGLSVAAAAFARAEPPARISVAWAPTAQLSEVKDNQMQRGWMRPGEWEQALGDHLRRQADRILPPDQQLQVTIDDIKLAGSFEPWHGPNSQDIRFMKEIYPPRLTLHYKLLGPDGAVLREADAKLWDGAYLQKAIANSTDPLRYDKRLIDDWLYREFRTANHSG